MKNINNINNTLDIPTTMTTEDFMNLPTFGDVPVIGDAKRFKGGVLYRQSEISEGVGHVFCDPR